VTDHHYFVSCGYGWALGETRDAAIVKLATHFRYSLKENIKLQHMAGEPGAYVWSCKVMVPIDSEYEIEWYRPSNVPIENAQQHYITYLTKNALAYTNRESEQKPDQAAVGQ